MLVGDRPSQVCEDILEAAREGKVDALRRFLKAEPDSHQTTTMAGRTPLHLAAYNGHQTVVQQLLAAKAAVEVADDIGGDTPLHLASKRPIDHPGLEQLMSGLSSVVQQLLKARAAVDAGNGKGETPLHLAASNGHVAVVQQLLAAKAAMEVATERDETPLRLAAYNGHVAVVQRLLAAKAAVDAGDFQGRTAYDWAKTGCKHEVIALLDAWTLLESPPPAQTSAREADVPKEAPPQPAAPGEIVVGCQVELQGLKSKTELNGKGATALWKDESTGRWEVKLDGPADERVRCKPENLKVVANAQGGDANKEDAAEADRCKDILRAAGRGNLGAVRHFLRVECHSHAQKDANGWTPLHVAAEKGHEAVTEQLLAAQAAVEARNSDGRTALQIAVHYGHGSVVQQLLTAGAAVDATDDIASWTALHFAVTQGHCAVAQQLLLAGAGVDEFTREGWTPLHLAAGKGHSSVVEELLAANALVDARGKFCCTPLHCAAENGRGSVVERLLAAGAAVDAADSKGKTPFDLAKVWGHREVMALLEPAPRSPAAEHGNQQQHNQPPQRRGQPYPPQDLPDVLSATDQSIHREQTDAKNVRDFGWYHPYRLGVFKELENATEQGAAGLWLVSIKPDIHNQYTVAEWPELQKDLKIAFDDKNEPFFKDRTKEVINWNAIRVFQSQVETLREDLEYMTKRNHYAIICSVADQHKDAVEAIRSDFNRTRPTGNGFVHKAWLTRDHMRLGARPP